MQLKATYHFLQVSDETIVICDCKFILLTSCLPIQYCDFNKDGKVANKAEELSPFWLRYLMKYAAFGTTTHFVERRSVKIYNYCSNKSRSEERVTQFAICYNIKNDVNHFAKETMIEAKVDKGQAYKNDKKLKAVGKLKNDAILSSVVGRHEKIQWTLEKHSSHLKPIYDEILTTIKMEPNALSFKKERQSESFINDLPLMMKERKKNKIETKTGVVFPPAVRKEVHFFSVKQDDIDGVKAELTVCGFTNFAVLPNITQMKEKLKEIYMKQENIKLDKKEVKHFRIKSNYDWSHLLE